MKSASCEERVDQAPLPAWGIPPMVSPLPWEVGYWGNKRGKNEGFHGPSVFDVGGREVCRPASASDADFIVYATKLVLALQGLHTDELAELLRRGAKR